MTSLADELRQAAAHIREVAAGTSHAPWTVEHRASGKTGYAEISSGPTVICETYGDKSGRSNADGVHIALWDPDVAELVARVLDAWANMVRLDPDLIHRVGGDQTLAVARAINAKAGGA